MPKIISLYFLLLMLSLASEAKAQYEASLGVSNTNDQGNALEAIVTFQEGIFSITTQALLNKRFQQGTLDIQAYPVTLTTKIGESSEISLVVSAFSAVDLYRLVSPALAAHYFELGPDLAAQLGVEKGRVSMEFSLGTQGLTSRFRDQYGDVAWDGATRVYGEVWVEVSQVLGGAFSLSGEASTFSTESLIPTPLEGYAAAIRYSREAWSRNLGVELFYENDLNFNLEPWKRNQRGLRFSISR